MTRGHSLERGGDAASGVGRRERIYQRVAGADVEADLVVTEHEPCGLIAWRIEAWRVEGKPIEIRGASQAFRLHREGAATRVRMTVGYQPRSRWQRLMSQAGGRFETRQLERALKSLDALCGERPDGMPGDGRA